MTPQEPYSLDLSVIKRHLHFFVQYQQELESILDTLEKEAKEAQLDTEVFESRSNTLADWVRNAKQLDSWLLVEKKEHELEADCAEKCLLHLGNKGCGCGCNIYRLWGTRNVFICEYCVDGVIRRPTLLDFEGLFNEQQRLERK